MATIKVKLRPSLVANRASRVIFLVTHQRASRLITTSYRVFAEDWNSEEGMLHPAAEDRQRDIAEGIWRDVSRLEQIISTFEEDKRSYTVEDIVEEYAREEVERKTFLRYMEGVVERLKQLNRDSTALNYNTSLERFRKFLQGRDILIESIDYLLIEDYEAYLRREGLVPNSISFYMRILRAVYNRAIEQGITQDKKPFRTVFIGMEKTRKRAVSSRDIKRLHRIDLSSSPHLSLARDIFMFLFFCRGMSFVDAAFLKKSDIKDGVLTYRRRKTKQLLHIKVEQEMLEIINRYARKDSIYLLPLINDFGDARRQYVAAIHRINFSLKKIGQMMRLPIPLTTYVSRHSWATAARGRNIPIAVISEALGHESEATTQIYLSSIDTSVIDKANRLIIKGLL